MSWQEPYEAFVRRMQQLADDLNGSELVTCHACDSITEKPQAVSINGNKYCCPDCYRPM